jgi:hypothetical protein
MSKELKAYLCDDSDVYAAESADQAAELYEEMVGELPEEGYPQELSETALDVQYPEFDENEARTGAMTSIRQMLAEHGSEPGWLCGSDW